MTEYEKLVDFAYKLVGETNKDYLAGVSSAYMGLILGIGPCRVEDYEGNGHSFRAVDDALHRYYKDNPESKVDEGFIEGIGYALDKFPFTETFETVVNFIKYEMDKAEKGLNTFDFDGIEMITDVKLIISANSEFLKTDPDFAFWLDTVNPYFEKKYKFFIYKL